MPVSMKPVARGFSSKTPYSNTTLVSDIINYKIGEFKVGTAHRAAHFEAAV